MRPSFYYISIEAIGYPTKIVTITTTIIKINPYLNISVDSTHSDPIAIAI